MACEGWEGALGNVIAVNHNGGGNFLSLCWNKVEWLEMGVRFTLSLK